MSTNVKALTGNVVRFLTFSLGPEEYAVPLLNVREVIGLPDTTPVPYTPPHFLGIMNLRGQVISVLDLRLKFRMKNLENTAETAVIIADLAPLSVGIVVDSINSVLTVRQEDVQPRPQLDGTTNSEYITGVASKDEKLYLLLNLGKVLNIEDQLAIKNASHGKAAA